MSSLSSSMKMVELARWNVHPVRLLEDVELTVSRSSHGAPVGFFLKSVGLTF